MNDDVRTAILGVGLAFCVLFAGASLFAIFDSGPSTRGLILGGISLLIVWMIMLGLWGAMKNPPKR